MKIITGQQMHKAYMDATALASAEKQALFRDIPEQWPEVKRSDKWLFRNMARKMNWIIFKSTLRKRFFGALIL